MTELRKVRARKISSPSSFLIFPPSRQKNRKTAIRGKRKNQNVKKDWNSSSGWSATLHASDCGWILRLVILLHLLLQPSSLPTTTKKTRKKTKRHTRKYRKKKEQTRNKKIPSAFLSTSSSSSPSRSELHAIHVELVKSRKMQPECTRERARSAAKERGDCGAYLYNGGDRCERGLGHKGIIKPTGNGHVVVTRRPMYVKTVIVIHSIVKSRKVKTKIIIIFIIIINIITWVFFNYLFIYNNKTKMQELDQNQCTWLYFLFLFQ